MIDLSERDIETILDKSLSNLGYIDDISDPNRNIYKQQPKTKEQKKLLNNNRPDYILYKKQSNDILAIIEVKKPNKNLSDALEQAKRYAKQLNCNIIFAIDGYYFKSLQIKINSPLSFNDIELKELPNYEQLLSYQNTINIISDGKTQSKEALITLYKKANKILKNEGFSAGIDRFSQFANLMFYKIILEQEDNFLQKKWQDVIDSKSNYLKVVKNDLKKLFGKYSNAVTNTKINTKIKSEKNIKEILLILNEINFNLTSTDYKGDAFEYFIHSYTRGTKNDLGQYFTPRHIVKLCVYLLNIQKKETIYDPFCGTGGMLIESFKYVRQFIREDDLEHLDFLKTRTFYGNEITDSFNIAKMNMICAGDGHNNIFQKDTYKDKIENSYNKIITNIPFSQNTEYHHQYGSFIGNTEKNGDIVGILHCLFAMKKQQQSCCVIIVPISILYKEDNSNIALRKYIFENYQLDLVIDLHEHTFQPYTMQHTAILKIKNKINKVFEKSNFFKYFKLNNDGYSKNTYRIPIKENDIDDVINDRNYQKIYMNKKWQEEGYLFKKLNIQQYDQYVYLENICLIENGINISPNKKPENFSYEKTENYLPFYMAEDLSKNHISYSLSESRNYLKDKKKFENKIIPPNTILIVSSGQSSLKNHRAITETDSIISSTVVAFILKKNSIKDYNIDYKYLFSFFIDFDFKEITYDYGYPGTKIEILKKIKIPLNNKEILRKVKYFNDLRNNEKKKKKLMKTMLNL